MIRSNDYTRMVLRGRTGASSVIPNFVSSVRNFDYANRDWDRIKLLWINPVDVSLIDHVDIEYTTDGGTNWGLQATETPVSGLQWYYFDLDNFGADATSYLFRIRYVFRNSSVGVWVVSPNTVYVAVPPDNPNVGLESGTELIIVWALPSQYVYFENNVVGTYIGSDIWYSNTDSGYSILGSVGPLDTEFTVDLGSGDWWFYIETRWSIDGSTVAHHHRINQASILNIYVE